MNRERVIAWVDGYETAWRTPGTAALAVLFTDDATYLQGPYDEPLVGLDAIGPMWDDERDGADEVFQMTSEVLAVDGDTAVVRVEVQYGEPAEQHYQYRDLWIIRFAGDGRCRHFEEWPFWPDRPIAAR
jgi:ketosteroid isomerase-like protein